MPSDKSSHSPPVPSAISSDDGYVGDDWPQMSDGSEWDGKNLLDLVRNNTSPFGNIWDVSLLLQEVESKLHAEVVDVPRVHTGSNNYGFHLKLSDSRDVLARFANADVNMPGYDGFSLDWLHKQLEFEAATYFFLENVPEVPTSRLLYYRLPLQYDGVRSGVPEDISGRRLMIFEMTKGENGLWRELGEDQKSSTLVQAATIRAALLNLPLPPEFVNAWLLWRSFQPVEWMPKKLPLPISATRDFCIAMFKAKIESLIKNKGDIIGWEEDHQIVGPRALAAKQSLLRFISHMLPEGEDDVLYRLVLQSDDYGIHNMSIFVDETGKLSITSVYDWETGCIVPIILSEIEFAIAGCDLNIDENGEPSLHIRSSLESAPEQRVKNQQHSAKFLETIKDNAPYLENAIRVGKDARHLWFALKRWRGEDPETFFGGLGSWAGRRMQEMRVNQPSNPREEMEGDTTGHREKEIEGKLRGDTLPSGSRI